MIKFVGNLQDFYFWDDITKEVTKNISLNEISSSNDQPQECLF